MGELVLASYLSYAWSSWGVLTELVLGPVAPALSRAKATMTLLFSPAQWTTIWLWESFRLACRKKNRLDSSCNLCKKQEDIEYIFRQGLDQSKSQILGCNTGLDSLWLDLRGYLMLSFVSLTNIQTADVTAIPLQRHFTVWSFTKASTGHETERQLALPRPCPLYNSGWTQQLGLELPISHLAGI